MISSLHNVSILSRDVSWFNSLENCLQVSYQQSEFELGFTLCQGVWKSWLCIYSLNSLLECVSQTPLQFCGNMGKWCRTFLWERGLGTSRACIPVFMEGSWFLNNVKGYSLNKNICTALLYWGEKKLFCAELLRYLRLGVILNEADFCKNVNSLRLCLYLPQLCGVHSVFGKSQHSSGKSNYSPQAPLIRTVYILFWLLDSMSLQSLSFIFRSINFIVWEK